ncbi:MAG: hypothetical protein FWE13_02300, partial [Firmicutes bacterium]|nr:hypothetical protein [Bacillota bacterium]
AKKKNTPENKQPKAKEENKVSNTKKDAETIPEEDASIATRENTMSDTQEEATPDSNEEVNASKSN